MTRRAVRPPTAGSKADHAPRPDELSPPQPRPPTRLTYGARAPAAAPSPAVLSAVASSPTAAQRPPPRASSRSPPRLARRADVAAPRTAFRTPERSQKTGLTPVSAEPVLATLSPPRGPCSGHLRRRRRTPDTPLAARCGRPLFGPVGVVVSRVGAQRVLWCVPVASYDTPTTSTPRGSRERVARAVPGRAKS